MSIDEFHLDLEDLKDEFHPTPQDKVDNIFSAFREIRMYSGPLKWHEIMYMVEVFLK